MTQDWDAGRLDSDLEGAAFDTLAVRAGQRRTPEGEHGEALFTTSSYVFRTAADAAARFAGEVPGNVYSRYTNPTVRTFEERIAHARTLLAGIPNAPTAFNPWRRKDASRAKYLRSVERLRVLEIVTDEEAAALSESPPVVQEILPARKVGG